MFIKLLISMFKEKLVLNTCMVEVLSMCGLTVDMFLCQTKLDFIRVTILHFFPNWLCVNFFVSIFDLKCPSVIIRRDGESELD